MKRFRATAPLISVLALCVAGCAAITDQGDRVFHDTLFWDTDIEQVNPGPVVGVLHDRKGTMTFDQARQGKFFQSGREELAFGFLPHPVWLRLSLHNLAPRDEAVVLEIADVFLRRIEVFVPEGKTYRRLVTGSAIPAGSNPSKNVWPALGLTLPASGRITIFVRVESDSSLRIPLRLYTPAGFEKHMGYVRMRYGLNHGIGLYIFLSSLFIWYRVRERAYAYYILFQVLYTIQILALDGLVPALPAPFAADGLLRLCVSVFPALVFVFSSFFLEFAHVNREAPIFRRSIRLVQGATVLLQITFLVNFRFAAILTYYCLPALVFYFILAGGWLWRAGYRHMRYLFFATIPVLGMALFFGGAVLGLISHGVLFEELKSLNILSAIILSLSLADRFALMEQGYSQLLRGAVRERTTELLNERLRTEEAMRRKEQITKIVSHDLRSPLSAIKTNLPFLRKEPPLPVEEQKLLLREIEETIDNLLALSAQLIDADPVREGRPLISPEWCGARNLAAAAFRELVGPARQKDIRFANEIANDLELLVDRRLITRVLSNLISNAVKFCQAGNEVRATTSFNRNGDLRLSIADNGPGLSPRILARLFDSGETASTPGTQGEKGRGLGLILCREIALMHEGRLHVDSRAGQGATIHLELPGLRFRTEQPGNGSRRVVLLVEDYEPFREQVRFLLKKRNITSVEAGDGRQARRILEGLQPDLIITDISMPDMDGREFIQGLREERSAIPIWVITGNKHPDVEAEVKRSGAERLFYKPLDIPGFRRALDERFPGERS